MKVNPRSSLREVVKLGLEVFVASYGSTATAAALMFLVYPLARALNPNLSFHQFNRIFSVPYFPVQISVGFAVGGAADRAHGEACDIAREATTQAVEYRQNLILDKVSGDPLKLRADMEAFKRAGYWVELRFVDRPVEVALPDMVTRFDETGHWVPPDDVARGHAGAARAFQENKDFADRATLRMAAAGERHQLVYDSQGRNRRGT